MFIIFLFNIILRCFAQLSQADDHNNISLSKIIKQGRLPGEISREKCLDYRKYVHGAAYNGNPVINRLIFPHMVLVGFEGEEANKIIWGCGGSIISEKFVLTAAHCIVNKKFGPPTFIMHGHVYIKNDTNSHIVKVAKTFAHPEYKPPANYHDIGLIELVEDLRLNLLSRPACLKTNDKMDNNRVIATGWGKVGVTGPISNVLLRVDLELFNQTVCQDVYSGSEKVPEGIRFDLMVCAGSYNEIKDVCQGDSGGPLQATNYSYKPGMIEIIGIVSFGKPCGQTRWPGVYTRVSAYVKWIEDIVWPDI